MLSLPIPGGETGIPYSRVQFKCQQYSTLADIINDLTPESGPNRAHLDPDLRRNAVARDKGWRPIFGQTGGAQSHLAENGVGVGDLFLFFGWFRQTEWHEDRLRYVRGSANLHVLFGWMLVGSVIPLSTDRNAVPSWAEYHPHCRRKEIGKDTLYIAQNLLSPSGPAGAGVFRNFHPDLCLTAPGKSRTNWKLPEQFFPQNGSVPLTHHEDLSRWGLQRPYVHLRTVSRGQEFILDAGQYPGTARWAKSIIRKHARQRTG